MSQSAAIRRITPPADSRVRVPLRAAATLLCGTLAAMGLLVLYFDMITGAVALLAGWCGRRGLRRGLMATAVSLTALVMVAAWSTAAGKWIAPLVRGVTGLPAVPNRYVSIAVAVILIYVLGRVVGRVLTRRRDQQRNPLSGMWLGMVEGSMAALILGAGVAAVEPPTRMALAVVYDHGEWVPQTYERVAVARDHLAGSPIGRMLTALFSDRDQVLHAGATLAVVAQYDGALTRLKKTPVVADLLSDDPTIQRIVDEMTLDQPLQTALRGGRLADVLDSHTILRLLDDTGLAATLRAHHERLQFSALEAIPPAARVAAGRRLARLRGVRGTMPQVIGPQRVGQVAPRGGQPIGQELRRNPKHPALPQCSRAEIARLMR